MISPWRTGFALGAFLGLSHLIWSAVVAFGAAQPLIDFLLRIHFIEMTVHVSAFDPALAGTLVVATSVIGFVLGTAFAAIWNTLQEPRTLANHRAATQAR